MITVRTSPAYVNRVRQDWTANGGVYGDGGVYALVPSNDPFAQLGPTLDLTFAGNPTDLLTASTTAGYTLDTYFTPETYQIAVPYAIWEDGVGLSQKTFSQIVTFTRASTGTYFNSAGTLTTAAINEARFDYNPSTLAAQGLLIEESRTNSIRNNTMVGAVAGTPGTDPTNWLVSGAGSGITKEIVGTGTENGITYIDIRYSGTPTAGTNVAIAFEGTGNIAASSGQTWTQSTFVKLQAGAFTNTSVTLSLLGTNGTSGTEAFSSSAITSTPSNLRECRLSVTGGLANAGTTNVQPRVRIGYTVGAAIDITLRIGLPQLEQGAFATSVIPTTTTALTRSADVASVNTLSPWFNAVEGTIYAEASVPVAAAYSGYVYIFGVFNDGIHYYRQSDLQPVDRVRVGGVDQFINGFGAIWTTTGVFKNAQAYKANDFAGSVNGGAVATDTSGSVPSISVVSLGSNSGTVQFNGYLRRITYYPRRLANADLQAITA